MQRWKKPKKKTQTKIGHQNSTDMSGRFFINNLVIGMGKGIYVIPS